MRFQFIPWSVPLLVAAPMALADVFQWTVDAAQSSLTTTISATAGVTLSDTETNHIAGFVVGSLALPAYPFTTIHLTGADLSYTSNPTFNLTQPFIGGAMIVGFSTVGAALGAKTAKAAADPYASMGPYDQISVDSWLIIHSDNTASLKIGKVEMGQGTPTALLMIAWVIMFVLAATARGWDIPVHRVIAGGVGLLLVLVGNQLGKSRSMFLFGLRTPWTLDDEEVWIKSNRLAGKLMVAAGLAMIIAALLPISSVALGIIAGVGVAVGVGVPVVHSFITYGNPQAPQVVGTVAGPGQLKDLGTANLDKVIPLAFPLAGPIVYDGQNIEALVPHVSLPVV